MDKLTKLHLSLLNYSPLAGFAVYSILSGFKNELFLPVLLSGWIVVVIFQTILTAVYTPPKYPLIAILALLFPALFLLGNALFQNQDYAVVFIEMAAVDMMGVIIGLVYAFVYKALRDGTSDAPVFAILFTIGLLVTAGYFLTKLFLHFFYLQNFDWICITLVVLAVFRSVIFFASRLASLTNRLGEARKKGSPQESVKPKREMSAKGILITIGIWLIIVPALMALTGLFTAHQ